MESAPITDAAATAVCANGFRRRRAAFAVWCVVLVAAFFKPLCDLARLAATDLHSHTLLIPFISAYLIYVERRRLPGQSTTSWLPALVLGGVALGLVVIANGAKALALGKEGPTALLILAFVGLVMAGGFVCLGAPWMRAAAFPMAFLVFMAPLPERIVFHVEHWLKLASAETAAWFFDLAGTPVLHDGVFFRLPGILIEVAQECSGIRSSYVLFMVSLIAAYLFLRSPWRRAILVAVVIPLGIVRNGFRILVLGWLCVQYGPQMIHTWIHHRGGPVFFVLSLIPLFLLLYGLWRGEQRKKRA
ncbi:MAG: hypothetical protein QOE70_6125 [Chthoniobacter sp.]|jgi:exosortase C (VPDSG-CTERM-specific)|nr:hypothetical protein [Chthoniobacter sp.]